MSYSFFAMLARMKYIERWALMRNTRSENISEHSLEVAMLAHGLAIISKERCGMDIDPNEVALMGIFHDAVETITGDMPTPVKYYDDDIRDAYKHVEDIASHTMLNKLPDYMKPYYEPLFLGENKVRSYRDKRQADMSFGAGEAARTGYEWRLVKAADKLSALIKCKEEKRSGNREFDSAYESTKKSLSQMDLPAVDIFMDEFMPAYDMTLDELQQ